MTSLSSKTVFIMDHSHTLLEPSGVQIEIDVGQLGQNRTRGRKLTPEEEKFERTHNWKYISSFYPPVMKTLWTCAVENVVEYARIVYDVFSDERPLRILLSHSSQGQTSWLNSWESVSNSSSKQVDPSSQQSVSFISEAFANAGQPPALKKQSITGSMSGLQMGIKAAIDGLSHPTPAQTAIMNKAASSGKAPMKCINRGRVICITSCTTDALGPMTADDFEDFFVTAVSSQNRVASSSDHLLPIVECELVLISLHPIGKESLSRVISRPQHEITTNVRGEVYVVTPDKLNDKLVEVCATHHDLVTTTVTNIPMKEEQNAVSSSNYDVPLFHAKMPSSTPDTKMLKWATPVAPNKNGGLCPGGVIQHWSSATRVSPVDVNSRPSTCLSNFVVSGRSVWLELPTKKGKQPTHVLTPHGPEIWMHVMESKNTLEDLPAISEGVGGRITDYRITDFADFIKSNLLIPYPPGYSEHLPKPKYEKDGGSFVRRRSSSLDDGKKPIDLAKARLVRKTAYWPLTLGGSVLFSLSAHIEKLLTLMPKEILTDMEKVECDKVIWALMSLEARGDAPPVPTSHFRKGMKRDEQWKMVYGELETFMRANLHSDVHTKVLECLLESRSVEKVHTVADPRISDAGAVDKGSRTKDYNDSEMKHIIPSTPKSPVATDSPMSPPMSGAADVLDHSSIKGSRPNLLTLWMQKTEKPDLRKLPGGKLYAHLASANSDQELLTGKSSRKTEA